MKGMQTTPGRTGRSTEKTRKQPPEDGPTEPQAARQQAGLKWVSARLETQLVRDIDAHAERTGTTRSDAIRDCLAIGRETITERAGIPAGRAEQLLEASMACGQPWTSSAHPPSGCSDFWPTGRRNKAGE